MKSGEKLGKVANSGEKRQTVGKSSEKWGKAANLIRALVLQLRETQALFFSKWPPAAILDSDFCQNR